ncbi:MAG: hypothetical protein NC340_09405 [Ruminococcus flavefaciens]|nr:hypothetical protein [Ruminococcus flavefaciens]MCM1230630.1 hypothetical protein [Ruminococcus flavefaciens]
MEKRSVIFIPSAVPEGNIPLKCKLRTVNPCFRIQENVKVIIDERSYDNAYRVYDPYEDEERFLRLINNFTKVCGYGTYLYITDDGISEVNPETNTKTSVENMQIIDDEAEYVGNMMVMLLASVLNACPELKPIVDIGRAKPPN